MSASALSITMSHTTHFTTSLLRCKRSVWTRKYQSK